MAAATSRYDFYVAPSGALIKRRVDRPSGRGRWPKRVPLSSWAVSVEYHDGVRVTKGPLWTAVREAEAIVQTVHPQSTSADLGTRVPSKLRHAFAQRLEETLEQVRERVGRRWRQLHTENAMVGVLVGELDDIAVKADGWTLSVDAQTFSDKVKEPLVGADLGWRVMIREGSEETVKAILMQAKKTESLVDWPDLPDLATQMEKMATITDESYGLIFTPGEIVVTTTHHQTLPLLTVVTDAVTCKRGDQSPAVVATSVDAKHVVAVDVQGPRGKLV